MAFTEPRVLLVINLLLATLFIGSCVQKPEKPHLRSYNIDSLELKNVNGAFYVGSDRFSGLLYALNPEGDSVFSRCYIGGLEDGIQKKWYSNGMLEEIRQYTMGKKTGINKGFWPNGSKRYIYHFINDLNEGVQYEWYSNDTLYSKKNYSAGYESGLQQSWNLDGAVKSNYEARNGRNYGYIGKKNCNSVWKDATFVSMH
ncbi:MAG: hypothetical protein H7Y07_12665 [Pyrinomonadaceae bacterium]|nr:hypothetical protein [Sphingobacteriaceae bacterium]